LPSLFSVLLEGGGGEKEWAINPIIPILRKGLSPFALLWFKGGLSRKKELPYFSRRGRGKKRRGSAKHSAVEEMPVSSGFLFCTREVDLLAFGKLLTIPTERKRKEGGVVGLSERRGLVTYHRCSERSKKEKASSRLLMMGKEGGKRRKKRDHIEEK